MHTSCNRVVWPYWTYRRNFRKLCNFIQIIFWATNQSFQEYVIQHLNCNRYQIWKHGLSNDNTFNLKTKTWLRSGMVEDGIWIFFLTIKLLPYQIHSEHITNYNKMIVVLSLREHICGHKIEIGYFFIWLVNFHKIKNSISWSRFWPFIL